MRAMAELAGDFRGGAADKVDEAVGFGEQRLGYFLMRGRQYEVTSELDSRARDEPNDIGGVWVRGRNAELLPLASTTT